MSVLSNFWSLFAGSPKTTNNKAKLDKDVESYANIGRETRKQIAYHFLNGTDIPALIETSINGLVGPGLNIQSRTKIEEIDKTFELYIKEHSKKKNFEVTGRLSRDEAMEMCHSEKKRKGGILARHRYNTAWEIPYRLEFISADMIDVSKFVPSQNIINGLRKNKDGRVVGYWIYKDYSQKESIEIPAEDISVYMDYWMDISQYTMVARLSQILPELDDLLQYQKYELEAAVDRTQANVFWHTRMYDTVIDAMNELYSKLKTQNGGVTSETFSELTEISRAITKQMAAEGLIPGNIKVTPFEDKITELKSNTSSTYEPFNKNISKKIASSQGRSTVSTQGDTDNTNWSTIDEINVRDERRDNAELRRMREDILDEYLERLFRIGVQTGKIPLAWNEYNKNKIQYHQWEILRTPRIGNKQKRATSNKINLSIGATTLNRIYNEEGADYAEEMLKQVQTDVDLKTKIKEQYEKAELPIPEEYGINPIQQQGAKNNA